ncbi:DUF448 domain-containing protein [Cellulomonas sp. APG4]|uniref:YlxR family protein n=1 Tax=Cellulomonas sp. APG4 TaxID=1538656 RepID=UPI00137A3317|nr:DUF448 domain-containing protein [Cellulomonas sp. APG4]
MSRGARLFEAGPRVRLPERVVDGHEVAPDAAGPQGPVRTCVGCRARGQRSVLIRVVAVERGEDFLAVVDRERSLPGRGAWVHADLRCLDLAERRRALPRALRRGPLDTASLRAALEQEVAGRSGDARPSSVEKESGLEADGHPMSTQR